MFEELNRTTKLSPKDAASHGLEIKHYAGCPKGVMSYDARILGHD
jgi:hypothetical protein